jgi:hypothetical protein
MAKRDDIPKTDPSEIEALIQRLEQSNIEPRAATSKTSAFTQVPRPGTVSLSPLIGQGRTFSFHLLIV